PLLIFGSRRPLSHSGSANGHHREQQKLDGHREQFPDNGGSCVQRHGGHHSKRRHGRRHWCLHRHDRLGRRGCFHRQHHRSGGRDLCGERHPHLCCREYLHRQHHYSAPPGRCH